ncbi:MAG: hypothetical protein RLZZ226_1862, partial [Pseudomonadota bacterium]
AREGLRFKSFGFVMLRAGLSLPIALHPASRRRDEEFFAPYAGNHSAGLPVQGFSLAQREFGDFFEPVTFDDDLLQLAV